MSAMFLRALAGCAALALGGCGTCVSVIGTYDEVWAATREVMESVPEQSTTRSPRLLFGEGTIEIVTTPKHLGGELFHRAQIEPVGGEGSSERKVCIRIQYLDPNPDDADSIRARRRVDLEEAIRDEIARRFGVSVEAPEASADN